MRIYALILLLLFAFPCLSCQRTSSTTGAAKAHEEFLEPKPSSERTAYLKLASKKSELEKERADLEKNNQAAQVDFINKHGGGKNFDSSQGPSMVKTPEAIAARKELAEIKRAQGQHAVDLNKQYLTFLDTEYFPGLLSYAAFCHKAFLAEPNKANGGELVQLCETLYDNENLDEAYQYTSDLIKNGFDSLQLYDLAAASAYCMEHFDEALDYYDRAQKIGQFTRTSLVANKEEILVSQKAWEAEKEIRAKEAAANDLPRVKLETEVGDIVYELFENEAPETVANFISLVESGYYDDTTFYSVVLTSHFFHGCKTGDNRSTPGYKIYCETDKADKRFPFRGGLTMFIPAKNEGGSIYTLSIRPSPFNFGYCTTFGRVIEGMDVLPKIAKYNLRFPMAGMVPTKVKKATVLRKRDHEYKPHKVEAN